MHTALYTLLTLIIGFAVFSLIIPEGGRKFLAEIMRSFVGWNTAALKRINELGGYVHDTAMCQFTPPTAGHYVTGTWTQAAGATAGTQAMHKAAAAETTTIHIPIITPSNSVAGKGTYLKYVDIDHEISGGAATSFTLSIVKVTLGADTVAPVPSAPAGTQLLTAATTAASIEQHHDRFTLTAPAWIDDDELYYLKVVAVCAAGTVLDIYGIRAFFTARF